MTERESTAGSADALIERATAVMREFEASGQERGQAIDDLIAMNDHLSEENEALYAHAEGSRRETEELRRRLSVIVGEADELATHHRRLVVVLSEILEAMRVRMRSLADEDRRIEAAREIAYSRARFGIGRPDEESAALVGHETAPTHTAPVDHGVAKLPRASTDADDVEDALAVRDLKRVISNFGRAARLEGQRR